MITAQIATIPERVKTLERVIGSLLPQVDKIRVMLNNYNVDGMGAPSIPGFLNDEKIEYIFCDNSLLDGYKFLKADTNEGYVLICDDDILYPHDFAQTMIAHLEALNKRAVLSIMGKNLLPLPITSYAKQIHECFRAFEYHTKMYEVQIIGMCGAIYNTKYCKISEKDMFVQDSDVCASAYCFKHNISMYVVPHKGDWCQDLSYLLPSDTVTMWNLNKATEKDCWITDFINDKLMVDPDDDMGK